MYGNCFQCHPQALIRGVLTRMALVQFRRAQAALTLTRLARGMIARVRVLKKRVRLEAARNQAARRERKKMTRMEDAKDVLKRLGLYFHDSDSLDGFLERTSIRKLKKRT